MKKLLIILIFSCFQLCGEVEDSFIPQIDSVEGKLRIMTFNMLYNVQEAENKLPLKHRWANRMPRLLEYLEYADADIISSQELQEDQVQELMCILNPVYGYYGLKTRVNEGRSDTNAIFFKQDRFELLEGRTIFYEGLGGNGFSYCRFRNKFLDKHFVVINTKLSWGITWTAMNKRYAEAVQLSEFVNHLPADEPILVMGDFNTLHFLDGKSIVQLLTKYTLSDSISQTILGHFGPYCSINNSCILLTPFTGPELHGFILDRIFINEYIEVLAHIIDTAKVNGEYPSDHFPVLIDFLFK